MSLEDLFVSEHYDELYIVMELLDSDLHRIIQSPQALGDAHHRYFMFQLLKGVKVRCRRLMEPVKVSILLCNRGFRFAVLLSWLFAPFELNQFFLLKVCGRAAPATPSSTER